MKKVDHKQLHFHTAALRIAWLHILFVAIYSVQTVVFHASKITTTEVVWWRSLAACGLLAVAACVWMIARQRHLAANAYQICLGVLIIADLAFAAFNVYIQRGYASNSVVMFLVPIMVAAVFMSRSALIGTALLATATYAATAVSYFHLNFNEGYLSELYTEIALNMGIFLLTAGLLWAATHKHKI